MLLVNVVVPDPMPAFSVRFRSPSKTVTAMLLPWESSDTIPAPANSIVAIEIPSKLVQATLLSMTEPGKLVPVSPFPSVTRVVKVAFAFVCGA